MTASGLFAVDALLGDGTSRLNAGDLPGTPVTVTYSFMDDQPAYSSNGMSGFSSFTATMQAATRTAFGLYESVARIDFVEVSDDGEGGEIRLGGYAADGGYAGYAYYPSESAAGSDVWINTVYDYNVMPEVGNYGFLTLVHEIGHAIGLKHPGNYSGSGEGPFLSDEDDTHLNTVMSYHGPTVAVLGPLDVLATGWLYGPAGGGTIGTMTAGTEASEWLEASAAGGFVHGNGGADTVIGSAGDDGLTGGDDWDQLFGAAGNDTLYGNSGADTLSGGDGNDVLNGNQDGDVVSGDVGDDLVRGGTGDDFVFGNTGNDSVFGDRANDVVFGGAGDDLLRGGQNDDALFGDDGNDTLLGDLGSDTLTGGAGADLFVLRGDGGADEVTDFNAGDGDRVGVSGSYTITQTAEGTVLTGAGGGSLLLRGVDDLASDSLSWVWA